MNKLFILLVLPLFLWGQDEKMARPAENSAAIVQKGRGYVGLTFSVDHSKGENFKELNLIPVDQRNRLRWKVQAQGGYFTKDLFSVGGGIYYEYSRLEAELNDTSTIRSAESVYSLAPHIRNYLPWTKDLFFQIFNQTNLVFAYGTGIEENDNGNELFRTRITEMEVQLGIQPGLAVFVGKGVTVETSVSLLGLSAKKQTIEENGVETGYRTDAGVNFNLDLLSLNLGITVYI